MGKIDNKVILVEGEIYNQIKRPTFFIIQIFPNIFVFCISKHASLT